MSKEIRIEEIRIRNFRSIRDVTLYPGDLSVYVGRNDMGKSNIIRALNLFFNGESSEDTLFEFESDYNVHSAPQKKEKKAKEIIINLKILLPKSYRKNNGDYVLWEKAWRLHGEERNKYLRSDRNEFSKKSKVHALLRRIKFVYVPAIKDSKYFSTLQAEIYNTISNLTGKELYDSSRDFEDAVSKEVKDLTSAILNSTKIESRLAFPKEMGKIFSNLEFQDVDHNLPLTSRGDGIKVKHIPLMLNFIANVMRNSPSVSNTVRHNIFWGYEEPENSLEFSNCIDLAYQLNEFINCGNIRQIFLTTHSPIFYNICHQDSENREKNTATCYFVYRDNDQEGTMVTEKDDKLDERMGTIDAIGKMLEGMERKIRYGEKISHFIEEIAKDDIKVLFVEGGSDKIFFEKALKVLYPDIANKIRVLTHEGPGGGDDYVFNMLNSWEFWAKHESQSIRVAGLYDLDDDICGNKDEYGNDNRNHSKSFSVKLPLHVKKMRDKNFHVPGNLEALYDLDLWKYAKSKGYITHRKNGVIMPDEYMDIINEGNLSIKEILKDIPGYEEDWYIILANTFYPYKKVKMAKYVAKLEDSKFNQKFQFIRWTIDPVVNYLFRSQNTNGDS